jgi:hypothetical protein
MLERSLAGAVTLGYAPWLYHGSDEQDKSGSSPGGS